MASPPSGGDHYNSLPDDDTSRQTSAAPFSEMDEEGDSDYVPTYESIARDDVEYVLNMADLESGHDDDDDDDDENDEDYVDEEDEEGNEDFEDASEQLLEGDLSDLFGNGQVTIRLDRGATEPATEGDEEEPRQMIREFLRFLSQAGLGHVFTQHRESVDDDDDEEPRRGWGGTRSRRRARPSAPFPKVPSDKGRELMESGNFGTNERDLGQYTRNKSLACRIMRRELGIETRGKQKLWSRIASQSLIPCSKADTIVHYDSRCYSGQFSDDGNFFFSCSQDFNVRMYDTSNPYDWKHYRTVRYPFGQWTITDASLSPDNRYLAYSSIRNIVCLAHTDPDQDSEPYSLDFANMGRYGRDRHGYNHFGIWSIRFSGDGRELVAGTSNNQVYVYDIETHQSILGIRGHDDDVNAVCFGDTSSPHLLYSGSDDTTLKVWDRRSLSDERPAGVFLGHTEGITFVDSKGDGRYVLSNGKDQTMKLWDLRRMISADKADSINTSEYTTGFDYRFQDYDDTRYHPHPYDCSLVTFRGHRVLKTLIRCHFSPPGSTDSRYVYSGSEDGSIYVYNLDATIAAKIDIHRSTRNTRPRGDEDPSFSIYDGASSQRWMTCVRDASWHPYAPVIAATSWNGYGMTKGTCTVHTWNDGLEEDEGEPAMGNRVNDRLQQDRRFYEGSRAAPQDYALRRRMLRAIANQMDD